MDQLICILIFQRDKQFYLDQAKKLIILVNDDEPTRSIQ